jgi:hypothetical protein
MDLENSRLELESRPTLRQWREAKQEIKDLTQRLLDSDRLMRDHKDVGMLRKYSSVGAAAAQDRDNYRLALHTIDALPKEYTKEVYSYSYGFLLCCEYYINDVMWFDLCLLYSHTRKKTKKNN